MRRFQYDKITGPEAARRLNLLDMKRETFARLVGAEASNLRKSFAQNEPVAHWMHLLIRLFENCPGAIAEARQLAAECTRSDAEHPNRGDYPYLEPDPAEVN